jgi:hypothetical protein
MRREISSPAVAPRELVDEGKLYWLDQGTTTLYHGRVRSGKLHCDGSVDDNCTARLLAIDDGKFYWVDEGTTILYHGRVAGGKLHCDGSVDDNCTARLLAADNSWARRLVGSPSNLYWIDQHSTKLYFGDLS